METLSRKPISPLRLHRWRMLAGVASLLLIAAVLAASWTARRAEPLLRQRVIRELSSRFHSPVELDSLHLSLSRGLLVEGQGLRILYLAGPNRPDAQPGTPMISIPSFQFRTGLRNLLAPNLHAIAIEVQGAEVRIPPKPGTPSPDSPQRRGLPPEGVLVDRIVFTNLKLVIETRTAGKLPLAFNISNLTLTNAGRTVPLSFDATLENPKPVGHIHSTGRFGPWQDDNPRDTPISGHYSFTHADLASIKGLRGFLSSTGDYTGTLGHLAVEVTSDVPDFQLTIARHPLPLHTTFHADVDALTGDTHLSQISATLAHSHLTARGAITRKAAVPGHDVDLDVAVTQGRIDDFLLLSVRTSPPVLRGGLTATAHIHVPPGTGTVSRRMDATGSFSITGSTFSNPRLARQIDDLSMRARGWPEKANPQQAPPVTSSLSGIYLLQDEAVQLSNTTFTIPGGTVQLDGQYGLDGASLDFRGNVRTEATVSEMVGGWKSLLLMPFDHLLKKNGAGTDFPFKLTGTQADPKLDLDFGRHTPAVPLPK